MPEYRRILLEGSVTTVVHDGGILQAGDGREVEAATAQHLPPSEPTKILAVHLNYQSRVEEFITKLPPAPTYFHKPTSALNSHRGEVVRPQRCNWLNYEGEIAIVVGKGGRRIPKESALDHIAGLTCLNEGTIRDWTRHGKFNVTQGKNWDASGAIGPWLVTLDEVGDFDDLHLTTHVNGELRQDDTPTTMAYPIEYQVEYLSTFCTLEPGDVIFTGTPTGAGARFDPPRFLQPGDVVEVSVPELGTLRNGVRDE